MPQPRHGDEGGLHGGEEFPALPLHVWARHLLDARRAGLAGERVAAKAYACPQCGHIEHYIRRLEKDRDTILSAPTTYQE